MTRLLTIPCAGASATMYLRWRRHLPSSVQLVPLEPPGRGARLGQSFIERFDGLVSWLCQTWQAELRDRYVLFGHSMGALLAWGMAVHQRRTGGRMPEALLLSACAAPSQRDPDRFRGLDSDESLMADLRAQGGTSEAVFAHPDMLRMTLDTLRADYRVCDSFVHDPDEAPLALPVHVLAGRQDDISPGRLEAWRRETVAPFSITWFEGNHFFIWQEEARVLAHLRSLLSSIQPD